MPYRKYTAKDGKYGPIYHIVRGISVCKNENENWLVKINRGGERKNKTVGKGRDALIKAVRMAERLSEKLTEEFGLSGNVVENDDVDMTPVFAEYSKDWLQSNKGRWRHTSYERYEGALRLHILPNEFFSQKRLGEIKRVDVKKLLRALFKVKSAKSVELYHVVIHSIFEDAIDDELISGNPARQILDKVLPPKKKRRKEAPLPLNREEADLFLSAAEKVCKRPIALILKVMMFGGFRLGEVLGMRLEYVDFKKRAYQVRESYKREKFSNPKTDKFRWVDLPDFLLEELHQHITNLKKEKLRGGQPGQISLLFANSSSKKGLPFSQRIIQTAVKRVCRKIGITERSPHDLRHTYASWLLMAHQSPAYVQRQLGHSSIDITVDIYGHWISGEGRGGLEDALQPVQKQEPKCTLLHM